MITNPLMSETVDDSSVIVNQMKLAFHVVDRIDVEENASDSNQYRQILHNSTNNSNYYIMARHNFTRL